MNKNASLAEIKSAFHQKARELHPDKNIGKDTTILMQELNEAYDVLTDSMNRANYDLKFNAYLLRKAKKKGVDESYFYKENVESHKTPSFFSTNKEGLFKIEEWCAEYKLGHLFIYHPKLDGCKDNITFWNLTNNPGVSLPVNFDNKLRQQLRAKLIPIIPLCSDWPCDNDVEIMVKLPKEQNALNAVFDSIVEIYKLPIELINFVTDKMSCSLDVTLTI